MKIINLFCGILFLFSIACQTTESKSSKNKEGEDYIVNSHNFDNYKKFDFDKSVNDLKEEEAKNQEKNTDTLQTYLTKMAHDFRLQQKQVDALKYIYKTYHAKETKATTENDMAKLKKLLAEKEKNIAVIIGEHYFAKKAAFDKKYKAKLNEEELAKTKLTKKENIYMGALSAKLKLSKDKTDALKLLLRNYKQQINGKRTKEVNQLNADLATKERALLGDALYFKKVAFDKTHNDYQNNREQIAALMPLTIRTMRTLNFDLRQAKVIEKYKNQKTQLAKLLGQYNYLRYQYFIELYTNGLYNVAQGNVWLNKVDTDYLKALNEKLSLTENEFKDLEMIIYHFKNLSDNKEANELTQLNTEQALVEKNLLGEKKYTAKLKFDKTYFKN